MTAYILHLLFTCYTILLLARIIGSWIPRLAKSTFMKFVAHYTDPYLSIFSKVIPPIGGFLDVSPILAFFVLQILEKFIMSLFR